MKKPSRLWCLHHHADKSTPLPPTRRKHTCTHRLTQAFPFFFSLVNVYFSQQPLPGLTRDTAWHHFLATAESQQAQELDQSLPKHKGARYMNPRPSFALSIFFLSPSLSAVRHAREYGNETEQLGEYWMARSEITLSAKVLVFMCDMAQNNKCLSQLFKIATPSFPYETKWYMNLLIFQ